MRRSGNKVLIIILIVVALLMIAGVAFAYTYFATDTFRSGQELFAKYLTQNIENLDQTLSLKKIDEVEEKIKQSKYEENITISYTEAEETESMGKITIDTQKDNINGKTYMLLSLMAEGLDESVEVEYMQEDDMYSLRFTDAVKQFLTVQNSDLKQLATTLGLDADSVEEIPDKIDFNQLSLEELKFTDEEIETEINKYTNILYNNISKEKYTKNKDVVITVNGKTVTTNAYILTLNMQEIKNLEIKLLETLKSDEIILSKLQVILSKVQTVDETMQDFDAETLKQNYEEAIQEIIDGLNEEEITEEKNISITVYEEKGNTVRIKLEQGLDSITLDTIQIDSKKQIDINYTSIDEENTQLSNKITFIKENDNKLNVQFTNINGEEQYTIELNAEVVESENNIKIEFTLLDDEDGKMIFSRNVNFVNEIEYKVELDNTNNIVLNELTTEQMISIFSVLESRIQSEYIEPLEPIIDTLLLPMTLIGENIIVNEGQEAMQEADFSEAEAAMFNSKFIAYEGANVPASKVNALLNKVLTHNIQESNLATERYVTVSGLVTLTPEDDSIPETEEGKYYQVICIYENNLVSKILIRDKEDQTPFEDITTDTENNYEDEIGREIIVTN